MYQRWLRSPLALLHISWSRALGVDVGLPRAELARPQSMAAEVSASGALVQRRYMRHDFDFSTEADSDAVVDLYQLTLLSGAQNKSTDQAIVTHVCGKDWAPGALALGASLKAAGTSRNLVLMVTDTVGRRYEKLFASVFDKVYVEEPVTPHQSITRAGADCVTLQLRAWQLPYKKVLYMDADMIALKTHDPVLDTFSELSARQDSGLASQFNGGMFVLEPSEKKFQQLRRLLKNAETPEFSNGGIQQFLNHAFPPCEEGTHVGCWQGKMDDVYNKFTRDVKSQELDADEVATWPAEDG